MDEPILELNKHERTFIREHIHADVPKLLLQKHQAHDLDLGKMAGQILARQKARYKLPAWYANERLLFPPPLSVEQGSSEAAARFKASLVSGNETDRHYRRHGRGLFLHECRILSKPLYFDQQPAVAQTAAYNFGQLDAADRIEVRAEEAIAALSQNPETADWIYADPARRDDRQRKVAQLADCTPDLTQALPTLFRSAPNILVKTAPLLDIDLAVAQLQAVRAVHVIGLESECKEVLYTLERGYSGGNDIPIRVRLLNAEGTPQAAFDFTRAQEAAAVAPLGAPETYLYEPHAALLKAGAFKSIATHFGLVKLAPNTHLYTGTRWVPDFPGRGFRVVAVCKPHTREIGAFVPDGKANLTIRNFPGKIDDLRKKWRLKEGGDVYLFASELFDTRKVVIVAQKAYL